MIDASLNEVEGLAAKAARGAGLPWGLCDDTGKCARWLASNGCDWAPSLLALLSAPVRDHTLSPIMIGSHLADLGLAMQSVGPIDHPLWLLPPAAQIARGSGQAMRVSWDGIVIDVWPFGGTMVGPLHALYRARVPIVQLAPVQPGAGDARPPVAFERTTRSSIGLATWRALEALGAHTYVPASAQSRSKGAGAGLTDND